VRAARAGSDLAAVATADLTRAAKDRQRVIYGVDNRKDLYLVTTAKVKAAAASVVALVKKGDLTRQSDGSFVLDTSSFQAEFQLCGSEPFVNQPLGCFCSGFLVAPDVIATAGHCVKSAQDLANIRFVFGFRMNDAQTARTTFAADEVYSGAGLIGRSLADDGTDWALVRLDRAASGRSPVTGRTSGKISGSARLYVIGHPCGLPLKYAPGAKVRDNAPAPFFVANLDTYGGNSGSPVFNAANHRVEGILVRGETDFVSNGSCFVSLVCPSTGCRGEDVTRSTIWAGKVPKARKAARSRA
jgi:Trypsin-like peptidase domain